FSYLRDQVAPASSFTAWAREIIAERRKAPHPLKDTRAVDAIDAAIDELLRCGTAVVGEITNSLFLTFDKLAKSPLAGVVFWELLGFNLKDPSTDGPLLDFDPIVEHAVASLGELPRTGKVRASLAAHAPYSVAPLFFRA